MCPACNPPKKLVYDVDDCGPTVFCRGCGRREYGEGAHVSTDSTDGHFSTFHPGLMNIFINRRILNTNREGE
jgi:hypothetical protein